MTAKELQPGMQLHTSGWGVCTVLGSHRAGKWLIVELRDLMGETREFAKFPNSAVVVIAEESHQP